MEVKSSQVYQPALLAESCSGKCSGQIVGERGGTAFPFRFWRRNAVPLAYTMTAILQHKQQKNVR